MQRENSENEEDFSGYEPRLDNYINPEIEYQSKARKKGARILAEEIIRGCKIKNAPVKLNVVIDFLQKDTNLHIHPYPGFSLDLQGILVNNPDIYNEDEYFLGYNQNLPYNRKRFSIAHEIGHLCFTHLKDKSLGGSIKEMEANIFAAELLMPHILLKSDFKKHKDVKILSKMYMVSEEAMGRRIMSGNYLKLI